MSDFARIDPDRGPHAAADLTDDQVEYLCNLALWELAMRLPKADYMEFVGNLPGLRIEVDQLVTETRYERDLMDFEAAVLADLDELPVTAPTEPPTGMYL